jgi:hypothetical protein
VPQSSTTVLAQGTINGADLLIELVEPADHPSVVRITWPSKPSIIPPIRFNAVAAEITRLVASAATRHTQLRAKR